MRGLWGTGAILRVLQLQIGSDLFRNPAHTGQVRWRTCKPAPVLTAMPLRALVDERVVLKARHLPRNSSVSMRARLLTEEGDLWQSISHYYTDEYGCVDLTKHSSVGGSYVGCEPMGLFWTLQPAPGERLLRLRKLNVDTPFTVDVSVLEGHVSPSDDQAKAESGLAEVSLQRWYIAPGVRRIEVRQNKLVGTLFLPPGPGPFPAVLDLWGLARGLVEYRAALFASHGFACMTLAYFDHEDLPGPPKRINVGNSYFKAAWEFLCDHPQVCGDRMAIIGISFGVFVGLHMATLPSVDPRCVICINGPVWSYNKLFDECGVLHNVEQLHWALNEQGYITFKNVSMPGNCPPENCVQVEKLRCPLLLIIGEDDLGCASVENAVEIERKLSAVGKAHLMTRVSYPGAGHLIECPYTPTSRISIWSHRPHQRLVLWGGSLVEHAVAQEDSWRRILTFLESHLREEGST